MYKTYAVVFQNKETGKVSVDSFCDGNEGGARSAFKACYRHGDYRILAVVEVPELPDKKEGRVCGYRNGILKKQ